MLNAHPLPHRSGTPALRRFSLVIGTGVLLAAGLCAPAAAQEEPPRRNHDTVRLCDPTGCYTAWGVVDSDHDGVCDADELMAGSDPFDPDSRPLLKPVLDLAVEHKLPSFENGRGVFVAMPVEIVKAREEAGQDPLGAFPLGGRKDAMTRLGLTMGDIETAGLDLDRDGFTVGLGSVRVDGVAAARRTHGMNASLLSAGYTGEVAIGAEHGGIKSTKPIDGGTGTRTTFNDGFVKEVRQDAETGDVTTTRTNGDGSAGPTTVGQHRESTDGNTTTHEEKNTTTDPKTGDVTNVTYVKDETTRGGGTSSTSKSIDIIRDGDGKQIGTVTTTTVTYISRDGDYGSTTTVVEACSTGGSCEVVAAEYEDSDESVDDEEYVNPDADTAIVTYDVVEQKLKLRGAAVNVVRGWTAPGYEEQPTNPHNPGLIALIDSDLVDTFLLAEPARTTKAQPETYPGLPSPILAAPGGPGGGGCSSCKG
ncbi:hypothetical protein F4553_003477 [Allocatelliglobosispora scoriae]|uniref:Uncharacterized protein n=1 Tax=Allocatelliglobosispora scoriae TaxID=643052 RepID=A0A841BRR9_9ACTN|nr:hypothetical protein [Allocatelliglobosispora scoriae]MBB5870098.1 hypothetical protein [Allocatelliglobosispora scoriae]